MRREGVLLVVALLYSAAVVAFGRRLPRPASLVASGTALATFVAVVLLSRSTAQQVDGLLASTGVGRLLFYLALVTQQCGLFLTIILGTQQWARRHWWAVGGVGAVALGFVGLWLHVKRLDLPDLRLVFYGRHRGHPPAVLWMHVVMGGGIMYIATWGLTAFLTFLRHARHTYEYRLAGMVVLLYLCTGFSGLCTVVEAVSDAHGVDIAVVAEVKPFLRIFLSAGAMAILMTQIWLWPLWRDRRALLARYIEPELFRVRHDLLNLMAAEAERHLDIHPIAYAHRAIVEEVAARCQALGIPPDRGAIARMAASLLTMHRDNLLQDPGYGLVTSWEALMEEAATAMDHAMARTAWEQALRDGFIMQQVYMLMFLVLDSRAFREILLIPERPTLQAWHTEVADLIALVMQAHGHPTPRARTLAGADKAAYGRRSWGARLAGRLDGVGRRVGRRARRLFRRPEDDTSASSLSDEHT